MHPKGPLSLHSFTLFTLQYGSFRRCEVHKFSSKTTGESIQKAGLFEAFNGCRFGFIIATGKKHGQYFKIHVLKKEFWVSRKDFS